MSFYKIIAKIKYLLQAKDRHGVHSPFVYEFNDLVLKELSAPQNPIINLKTNLPLNHKQLLLLSALSNYYFASVFVFQDGVLQSDFINPTQLRRILVIDNTQPFNFPIENKDIVVVPNIHNSKQEFAFWQNVVQQDAINYSIDVFEAGLVFYNNDFKTKQQFVLKF